jgi:hypothetical protein
MTAVLTVMSNMDFHTISWDFLLGWFGLDLVGLDYAVQQV